MLSRCTPLPASLEVIAGLLFCVALAGCGPSDPLEAVRQRQAAGDFMGTLEPLRELLAEDRDDGEVNYLYGRALALTGQGGLAEWSLRKAMDDPEWLVPAGLQLAYGELTARNFPAGIETTTRILAADPENVEALVIRAHVYTQSRMHHEEALLDVERVFELDPDNLDAMRPKIHALLALDRVDEAEAGLAELGDRIDEAQMGSDLPGWHCSTSTIFLEESDLMDRAAESWAECVELHPTHPSVVRNAVSFYDGRQEYELSLEVLRGAYREQPTSREYRGMLAERLRAMGRAEEAVEVLREGTETDVPQLAAAAWIDLAKLHQSAEEWAEAADAAGRAVELSRSVGEPPPQLLFTYADALMIAGRLDESLVVVEDISLPAYKEMIRARVAQERGDPAQALEHFDEAFRLWPDNPWARYYAALAAEALGDFERAMDAYRYAIRISPSATDSQVRLARIILAQGNPNEALHMLFLRAEPGQQPLGREGELLAMELWGRLGSDKRLRASLAQFLEGSPDDLGAAASSAARGLYARAGNAAAILVLRGTAAEGLDLTDPKQADALEALVGYSVAAGEAETVAADVEAALSAHPEAAVFHAIRGLWLEKTGARKDEARAAYMRAVDLDPSATLGLRGLGRLALADDPEQSLAFFQRAAAADPDDAEAVRGEARALIAAGQRDEAEERLKALLAKHPLDADAAARLVRLDLERGVATDQTLERARRVTRFGRTPGAFELLARVHQQRSEPELARRALARARILAESQGG